MGGWPLNVMKVRCVPHVCLPLLRIKMWASSHFLSASVHVFVGLTIMVITVQHNLDYFIIEVGRYLHMYFKQSRFQNTSSIFNYYKKGSS